MRNDAAIDLAEEGEFDWSAQRIGVPAPNRHVIARFKAQGPGDQPRMNAVLRGYVEAQKRRSAGDRGDRA